jgi:FkbM family methyltransferase
MPTLTLPAPLSRLLEERVERRPLAAGAPVVVYGAGQTGRRVVRQLREAGLDLRCVLDQRGGPGVAVDGLPVFAPGTEPLDRSARRQTTVVVAVFNRDAEVLAIEALLRATGYGRVVGFVELHDLFSSEWPDNYWLSDREFPRRHAAKVLAGADRWADAASRALYEEVVAYRVTGDASHAPQPAPGPQYFPAEIPRRDEPLRYVDCGAYDGDTLADAVSHGERLESVCAFEPDAANFAALAQRARAMSGRTTVYLWPCAVADTTSTRRFAASAGEASSLAEAGDQVVQCVALDDVLPAYQATDLKMDIEGAEPEALAGARALISRCRPRLAICVYHRPDHLWSVPAAIESLGLDYAYLLRAHAHGGFDVVMYAVPREQLNA